MSSKNGWNEYALHDIASVHRGLSWSTKQERSEPVPGCVAVLRIPNVKERLDLRDIMYLVDVADEARKQCMATKNWTLLVSSNGNPDRVGDCVFIDAENDFVFASFLVALTSKEPSVVDPRYLYRLLKSDAVQSAISRNVQGSTGLNNINLPLLLRQRILVPPVAVQHFTCNLLHSADEAIDHTRAVIDQTRKLKSAMLQDLLTNGLPGRHKKYVNNNKVGCYPADWRLVPLDHIVDDGRPICYGILMPGRGYPGGVPVVKVKDIRGGQIDESDILLTSPELDEEYRRSRLRTGDLLMTIRGSTGRVAIVPATLDRANITQDTARLSVSDDVTRDYLYYALQGHALQQLVQHHTIGQAVKGINIEEVRKLLIPLPGDDERTQIVELFHRIEERLTSEHALLTRLLATKSALSQALLTGRVPVAVKGDE